MSYPHTVHPARDSAVADLSHGPFIKSHFLVHVFSPIMSSRVGNPRRVISSTCKMRTCQDLAGHLGILLGSRHEVIIVLLIVVVVGRVLLSSLSEVDLRASCAASALDNVVQVNLLETILLCDRLLAAVGALTGGGAFTRLDVLETR